MLITSRICALIPKLETALEVMANIDRVNRRVTGYKNNMKHSIVPVSLQSLQAKQKMNFCINSFAVFCIKVWHQFYPIRLTLNPFKGDDYFAYHFRSAEAIYSEQDCPERKRHRALLLVCIIVALHLLWLMFGVKHSGEWQKLVILDFVDLFGLPLLVPFHLFLSVPLQIKNMNYLNCGFIRLKHYLIIKDVLVGPECKPILFLLGTNPITFRRSVVRLLKFLQSYVIFLSKFDLDDFTCVFLKKDTYAGSLCIGLFAAMLIVYLNQYTLVVMVNLAGFLLMTILGLNIFVFLTVYIATVNMAICLFYCLTGVLYIRLNRNDKLLHRCCQFLVKCKLNIVRQVATRLLIKFQRDHIQTICYFLDYHRAISQLFFYQLIIIYSYTSSQLASIIRQPDMTGLDAFFMVLVMAQCGSILLVHLIAAHHSNKIHRPFKHFLPVSSLGVLNGGQSCPTKVRIRFAMFGQSFHITRQYGLQYGPFGLINMIAFAKVNVLNDISNRFNKIVLF